jgi:hypothetical protein
LGFWKGKKIMPNSIPGTPIKPIHLPGEKLCPHCKRPYVVAIVEKTKDKEVMICPYCKKSLPPAKKK